MLQSKMIGESNGHFEDEHIKIFTGETRKRKKIISIKKRRVKNWLVNYDTLIDKANSWNITFESTELFWRNVLTDLFMTKSH